MTFDEWYEQQNKGHSDPDKADMRAAWNFATTQGADARPVAELSAKAKWDIASRVQAQCERLGSCVTFRSAASQAINDTLEALNARRGAAPTVDARTVAWKITTPEAGNTRFTESRDEMEHFAKQGHKIVEYATRDAAPSDALKEDAKRLKQLEHALVYVAHSMHSEPQYMLAEGITLGDVSFVRVKVADIDVSVDLPESVARAMYDAAMQATATKDEERRIAIAASAPMEKT